MELIFQAGDLDDFFENEKSTPLSVAATKAGIMHGCIAALDLAEWHNLGTTGLSEPEIVWRRKAFWCCGFILESVLLDDAKRRALAAVHGPCVRIGSHPASSHHEAIYNLARINLLHVECENRLATGMARHFPEYGRAPKNFSDLRQTSYRVFGGFPGAEYPPGWIADVQGELQREADLAGNLVPPLTADEERMQFCFSEWQAGRTYRQINLALKRDPTWEHFEDEKAVRGPINAWGKRIGEQPRKGQPGRQPKSAQP